MSAVRLVLLNFYHLFHLGLNDTLRFLLFFFLSLTDLTGMIWFSEMRLMWSFPPFHEFLAHDTHEEGGAGVLTFFIFTFHKICMLVFSSLEMIFLSQYCVIVYPLSVRLFGKMCLCLVEILTLLPSFLPWIQEVGGKDTTFGADP